MDFSISIAHAQGAAPAAPVARRVGPGGCTIGRNPDNDLPLSDPERVVSGRHARLDVRDGALWVTDLSTNGTFLNGAPERLPARQAVRLAAGDVLTVGPYALAVGAGAATGGDLLDLPGLGGGPEPDILDLVGSAKAGPVKPQDPFPDAFALDSLLTGPAAPADTPLAATPPTPFEHVHVRAPVIAPAARAATAAVSSAIPDDYDPMADMGLGSPSPFTGSGSRSPDPGPEPTSPGTYPDGGAPVASQGIADRFAPAGVVASAAPASAPELVPSPAPLTNLGTTPTATGNDDAFADLFRAAPVAGPSAAAPGPVPEPAPEPAPTAMTATADTAPGHAPAARTDAPPTLTTGAAPALPRPGGNAGGFAPPPTAPPPRPAPDAGPAPAPAPTPAPREAGAPEAALAAFLAGLGVGDAQSVADPVRLLHESGRLLRALTQGLTNTMHVRAEFKSQMGLGVTILRAVENNPFKFSVDADQALERLLFRPGGGYLPAVEAAREAFEDIQAHEMAMIDSLRATMRALLARFEPATLEQRLGTAKGLDKLLPMARRSRYWDVFTDIYEDVARDATDGFMELFSDAFTRAYEDQIRRLAQARRTAEGGGAR